MYRTHNCGELRISDLNKKVTLSGWVHKSRDKGFMVWIDLRDRYGVSQLIFDEKRSSKDLIKNAKDLGREYVIQVTGKVIERSSKNTNIPTGEIEILVSDLKILLPKIFLQIIVMFSKYFYNSRAVLAEQHFFF